MTDIERKGKLVSIAPNSQTYYHFFSAGLAVYPAAEWFSDVFSVEISNNEKLGEGETVAVPVVGYFLDWCVSEVKPPTGSAWVRIDMQIGYPIAGPPTTWVKTYNFGPTPNNAICTQHQFRVSIPAIPYLRFRVWNEGDTTSAAFFFFWSFRTV